MSEDGYANLHSSKPYRVISLCLFHRYGTLRCCPHSECCIGLAGGSYELALLQVKVSWYDCGDYNIWECTCAYYSTTGRGSQSHKALSLHSTTVASTPLLSMQALTVTPSCQPANGVATHCRLLPSQACLLPGLTRKDKPLNLQLYVWSRTATTPHVK